MCPTGAPGLEWPLISASTTMALTVGSKIAHCDVTASWPYRFVRHPFYGASALAFLANSLANANWFVGLMGALAMTLLVMRTTTEEEFLVKRIGHHYLRYMKQTGRFVPRLSSRLTAQE